MTNANFDENDVPAEAQGEGSEATASGPAPQDAEAQDAPAEGAPTADADAATEGEELTVDDILNAEQSEDAANTDAAAKDPESELLHDLKRVQAEYANYRRRTEEQRHVEVARAKGEVVKGLIPVLDDLDRAAQHGDLVEGTPFAVIAEKVRAAVTKLGVESYGEKDEEFDPQRHEAIFQQPTPGVEKAVVLDVVELGYRLGDVELRPAKVVVAVPAE